MIDLGCGSGILSGGGLAGSGIALWGSTFLKAMIALARKHVPLGEFRVESAAIGQLPRCVAVAAVGECLNYLFDPANTKPKLAKLFRRIHAALEPGRCVHPGRRRAGARPGPGPCAGLIWKETTGRCW